MVCGLSKIGLKPMPMQTGYNCWYPVVGLIVAQTAMRTRANHVVQKVPVRPHTTQEEFFLWPMVRHQRGGQVKPGS